MTLQWRRNDFDRWRALYPWLSHSDQTDFYNQMAAFWPDQHQYDVAPVIELCNRLLADNASMSVVEMGGWTGQLAAEVLGTFHGGSLTRWVNYELCSAVGYKQVPHHFAVWPYRDRYTVESLAWPLWELNSQSNPQSPFGPAVKPDLFIASHVIEHLSLTHFCRLAEWLRGVPVVHFQAPLESDGTDWTGYVGAHILPVGWKGVCAVMQENCFKAMPGPWGELGPGDHMTFEYQGEMPELARPKTAEDLTEADPCVASLGKEGE